MPKGPRGEKRPADVIGAAVQAMRIATGEATEEIALKSAAAKFRSRGGKPRARNLNAKQHASTARKAARKRLRRK